MDCVCWSNGYLEPSEEVIYEQNMINVYNNEEKTGFQEGKLRLTNHRLFWHDSKDINCVIEVHLSQILNSELISPNMSTAASSRMSRQIYTRLVLRLERFKTVVFKTYVVEPKGYGDTSMIQFEFLYGGHNEFYQQLNQQIAAKSWSYSDRKSAAGGKSDSHSIGIAGIQRKIQDRLDLQDQKISNSFQDLNILMNQAKEMVGLSNVLITKISKANKQPSLSAGDEEDEDMKTLKSYFFSMGIVDNPVTKESSGSKYYKSLALEIYNSMTKLILEHGGIMTLADVYCRLNRARGLAGLVSIEDLLNACKELNRLNYDLKYNVYKDMNLHVLEIISTGQQNKKRLEEICDLVKKNECLTPYALSNLLQSSLIVAKKLLIDAENIGLLCRDDTYMGLRFYSNLFSSQ